MSSRYTWNNYKVLKQEDQEAWHQDVRLHKAYFKFRQTQTIHIVHAGMFSVKNQPFSTPSLSLPLKPIRITTVLFFMKFSAVLYLCLHLKHTILCWYVGQPHWAGESHYCLSLFLKWINLYSQLGFGYRGWYFHDKPPPPTCQNRMRLSSQPAQRQGDDGGNDIPQDILEPRVLLPLNREGAMEYLSFIGSTQKHTLHTIISALQAEKRANTTNWESCKTYRTQKKVFPFLCLSSGWRLKQGNTSSVSKPRNVAVSLPLILLLFSHEGTPIRRNILPHTTKTANIEGIKWKRNLGAHKSRVTELLYDLKPQHELTLVRCLSLT